MICNPSWATSEGSHSLPTGNRWWEGWPGALCRTRLGKTKVHALSPEHREIIPHEAINPAQLCSTLSLGKEVFQPQGLSSVALKGLKDHIPQNAFPSGMRTWPERELDHYLTFAWDNNLNSRDLPYSPHIHQMRPDTWDGFTWKLKEQQPMQGRTTTSGLSPEKGPVHGTPSRFQDLPSMQTHNTWSDEKGGRGKLNVTAENSCRLSAGLRKKMSYPSEGTS